MGIVLSWQSERIWPAMIGVGFIYTQMKLKVSHIWFRVVCWKVIVFTQLVTFVFYWQERWFLSLSSCFGFNTYTVPALGYMLFLLMLCVSVVFDMCVTSVICLNGRPELFWLRCYGMIWFTECVIMNVLQWCGLAFQSVLQCVYSW